MPGPEDDKEQRLKTPAGAGQRTTPVGTPPPSAETTEFNRSDPALVALEQRYDLLAELGHGGMGIVYKARDRETDEIVALKVLKPDIAARGDLIERFKAELRLARKITHKNVCRSYELLRFADTVVIAMEYVEGESLRAFLGRYGSVPLRRGLEWAGQICSALAEAHAQGIIHRDLKPENILIDRHGQAKVMDFGIARSLEAEATTTGTITGTPAYMSPEQAEGKPTDARSDIYSLGLILYEMFTGRAAFRADTPVTFALKQIHETAPPPRDVEPDLPARIDRAIQKCLEKDPKKRFQTAAELEAALSEKAEAKPPMVAGAEVELPPHLIRWQRSDWLLVASAIVGLALFFPFFNRTSLAPRSQVHFDRSVLLRIAQEYSQKLGAPLGSEIQIDAEGASIEYDCVAIRAGAGAALELANNPTPYWWWRVNWGNGTQVVVDGRGSLVMFWRAFFSGTPDEKLSLEEARPLAEKALRDNFNCDPSLLGLENAANETYEGHPASLFTWLDQNDYHGLKRRYVVRLVGRAIGTLNCVYSPPARYERQSINWQVLPVCVLALIAIILGFFQRKRVDPSARWRTIVVALAFVVGMWDGWRILTDWEASFRMIFSPAIGLAYAVGVYFGSIAVERSVVRIAPAKFLTEVQLFSRRAASEPCGLAILRGILVGLAVLGADTFLVWVGTSHLGMRLDSFRQIDLQAAFLSKPWPSPHVVLNALSHALMIAGPVAFIACFLARIVRRSWLAVLVAGAMAALCSPGPLSTFGSVQPYHMKLLLLLFDCLILVWTFTRFDVLTLASTVFTFAFCWLNYSLLVMFEPAGNLEQWIAFAGFGLLVLAATAIAFKSNLRLAYQRMTAAFQ